MLLRASPIRADTRARRLCSAEAKFSFLPKQPTALRAYVKLIGLSEATDPPADFAPPFRGPATITVTYTPTVGPEVARPGLVRDCKANNSLLVCREP